MGFGDFFSGLGRAISSPTAQSLLKGALDVGVGLLEGFGGGGGLTNPNKVGTAPRLSAAQLGGGVSAPSYIPNRPFPTFGDTVGGTQMALLGAPVLAAARGVLPALGAAVSGIFKSPTARSVAIGAATGAAVDYLSGPTGMPRMRVPSRIYQMDEATGLQLSYSYDGKPVLYSRDLAVIRRVRRVQRQLNRHLPHSSGGRRSFR